MYKCTNPAVHTIQTVKTENTIDFASAFSRPYKNKKNQPNLTKAKPDTAKTPQTPCLCD